MEFPRQAKDRARAKKFLNGATLPPQAEMLRKPEKEKPLPSFPSSDGPRDVPRGPSSQRSGAGAARHEAPGAAHDEDESASTGEFHPLVHDVRSADPLPSFSSSGELPRFPSFIDAGEGGPSPARRSDPSPRSQRLPEAREPAKRPSALPRFPDPDVAATLEKRPMTANAAHRILEQLDRKPQRADSTGEIDLADVLEEVYAEPEPRSQRAAASFSASGSSRPLPDSQGPSAMRELSGVASRSGESTRPPGAPYAHSSEPPPTFVPAPPPSFTGTDFPQPPPRSAPHGPSFSSSQGPSFAASQGASFPSSQGSSFPPSQGQSFPLSQAPPTHAMPGYAGAPVPGIEYAAPVPAGYVLVPQASLMHPPQHAYSLAMAQDAALVRPLPVAAEERKEMSVLSKLLIGALILAVSALAGGAASLWLLPAAGTGATTAPSTAVPPGSGAAPNAPVVSGGPAVPAIAPPGASSTSAPPGVMAPIGRGWPLAPATVPPGAASMSPPAPTGSDKVAPTPRASAELPKGMGRIVLGPTRTGHRVWVDGVGVPESAGALVVKCGRRIVRIRSGGMGQSVDVPCGGEILVK